MREGEPNSDRIKIFKPQFQQKTPPHRKNSNQKMLPQQEDRAYSPLVSPQVQQRNHRPRQITYDLDYRDYRQMQNQFCFPKFMADLGACCTPIKIYCSCCLCCSCCPCRSNPVFVQQMTSLGLLQQWGRFTKVLEPGLHIINPISESIVQINQQTQVLQYKQVCISKDNVRFDITIAIFYRIVDSLKTAYKLGDMNEQQCLTQISCGTMRSIAGQNVLQEIIENRSIVSHRLTDQVNSIVSYWGIYAQICCLKDIRIDPDVQAILEDVAVTRKRSQAMIISYQGQVEYAKLCSQVLTQVKTKAAYQIRYLNTIQNILALSQSQNIAFVKISLSDGLKKSLQDTPLISL